MTKPRYPSSHAPTVEPQSILTSPLSPEEAKRTFRQARMREAAKRLSDDEVEHFRKLAALKCVDWRWVVAEMESLAYGTTMLARRRGAAV